RLRRPRSPPPGAVAVDARPQARPCKDLPVRPRHRGRLPRRGSPVTASLPFVWHDVLPANHIADIHFPRQRVTQVPLPSPYRTGTNSESALSEAGTLSSEHLEQ